MMIEVNSLNTPLTEELLDSLDIEVRAELLDVIDTIAFVNRLISPNRLRAKDRPRDSEGKIVVDITNPHILEDMDYFRQAAIYYQKHGNYTPLHPSSIPTSEYMKFWKEEARRCREGMIRQSDGEWIPGMYYWYLNYSPITKSKIRVGRKRVERVQDFPDIYDGDYWYFHYIDQARENGHHAMILKRRGCGASYKASASLARLFVLGDSDMSRKMIRGFALANEKEYLIRDGVLNKFVDHIDWVAKSTPWPRIRLKDSLNEMHWKMGFKERESNTEGGTENEIIGVSLMNDPDRARGKRGSYIFWEEIGKFGGVLKAWQIARPSVEEGDFAHGTMVGYGTGGAEGADFKGAEEFFYKSEGYNIFAIPNVFDRNINGVSNCGFFFPAYLNRLGCYDDNGNSDVIKALIEVLNHRIQIKYQTSDPNAVVQEKAETPITPQEAVLRREGSIFPILDLKDYLSEISPDIPRFTQLHYTGRFKLDSGGNVEWSNDQQHPVIREYPLKEDTDKTGCVELFEMPKRNNEGKVPRGRFIAGIDPIDYDSPYGTGSLGSIFVFDLWTDRIVAEYSGRPQRATDFYETCLRILKFYNAEANYENNLKGLFAYFDQNHALHYLCDSPQVLRDMDFVKGEALYGNRAKGTNASKGINSWSRKLQADWMITDAYSVGGDNEEKDENGKVIEVKKKKNLHTIGSIGYLKEAISWTQDVNADRVSAMGMVMILREDRLKYEKDRKDTHSKTIFDDNWFKRTYQKTGAGYNRLLLPKKKKHFDYY